MPDNPTEAHVAIWQASRRATHHQVVSQRAVLLRAGGRPVTSIARELGIKPSTLRHGLDLAGLRVLMPWLGDVPAWRTGRDDGHPDSEIAELYEVPEYLVRIALDGWPSTRPTPSSVKQEALRLWREGAEVTHVATAVGFSTDQLRQWLREGSLRLSPERLSQGQVAERFGWSKSLSRVYRLQGVLPAPDGGTKQNPWWWQSTITRVARTNLRYRCSQCRARFSTARGRSMHQTVTHRA